MVANISGQILLSELDFVRLTKLGEALSADDLIDTLEEADQMRPQEIPSDVITMYTQFQIRHLENGLRQKLTICYPRDAEPDSGFVSVLSRVGLGLLGRRVGSVAQWVSPTGVKCEAIVEAILFQPEASGDYTT
jgi:regulator of nucleoside diphosphate kinase